MWDWLLNLLLDNVAIPCNIAKELIDTADTDGDGRITMRELYYHYRMWRDG